MENNQQMAVEAGTNKKEAKIIAKMFIGSIIGILFFMLPIEVNGSMTIPLAWVKSSISNATGNLLPILGVVLMAISVIGSTYYYATKNKEHSSYFNNCFAVSPFNFVIRILALILGILAYFKVGPEFIWNANTGGLMIWDLIPSLILLFLLGAIALPLLTDYGAMELVGNVVRPVFRPLFRLPGRAAVLSLSAWFGNGTVGLLTTESEYKKGYYTAREAAIISVGFCIITYPSVFSYSTGIAGLEESRFGIYFLTCVLVGIISTAILCRIPPISKFPEDYYENNKAIQESDKGSFALAYDQGYEKAKTAPGIVQMFKNGFANSFKLYMAVYPTIIVLATIVLAVAEFTPVFSIIATPLVPLLNALGVPEASSVAPALFTGFADLLLPFLAATGITSQLSKFILCVLGTMQLICMSESGVIMMKSELPFKFKHMVFIFLEKTVIAFTIALIVGKMIGLA